MKTRMLHGTTAKMRAGRKAFSGGRKKTQPVKFGMRLKRMRIPNAQ